MANIKSQQKRNRTNERARLRNKSVKSSLRTAVRSFRDAAHSGDKEKAAELLVSTNRKLDKAASKGVIHKNQAANKKSALARASTSWADPSNLRTGPGPGPVQACLRPGSHLVRPGRRPTRPPF
ncbi:ribosomal protein S20 [Mycobacterium ulcerans str. Harvey]|uniref:Small ribosomal subunit protein bS20 n=2 Tax=Mycobacterium TaxID=1763 RepID=A0ABN0QSD2_MYCUL|nr:ribosomal protein S20 [Mycobacterium ulcerans str. Harvey]